MNMPAIDMETYSLTVEREFKAPAARVFRAWIDPEVLTQWFGPEGVVCQSAQVDPTVGGAYRLALKPPDGEITMVHGEYREIDPPRRLVFTWILDDQQCEGSTGLHADTLVTIDFEDLGSATRLTLTHDLLPTDVSRDSHAAGWQGCLDSLTSVI
jgi:uncharacterized protein YndB with AHSA1/START domain